MLPKRRRVDVVVTGLTACCRGHVRPFGTVTSVYLLAAKLSEAVCLFAPHRDAETFELVVLCPEIVGKTVDVHGHRHDLAIDRGHQQKLREL